ncbi:MAG TPA: protein kinase [Kofleriaceae bacterium]|nr:protein kinase [Kofleriaceae bacterium]
MRDEVVAIEDAGRATHGTMFVATEFMETRCVVGAPVPWQRVAAIMMRICGALDAMQAAGIADRRLDTTKVYWSGSEEQAKLDAVGLLLDGRDLPAPDAGEGVRRWWPGVQIPASWLEYASPERLMGKSLDARSDVYSAGVVAYELLTGRRPFAEAVGPAGLITMQLKRVPAPPSCVIPDIPTACDDVVLRCLAKARDDRYPDPRALRDALRALA